MVNGNSFVFIDPEAYFNRKMFVTKQIHNDVSYLLIYIKQFLLLN